MPTLPTADPWTQGLGSSGCVPTEVAFPRLDSCCARHLDRIMLLCGVVQTSSYARPCHFCRVERSQLWNVRADPMRARSLGSSRCLWLESSRGVPCSSALALVLRSISMSVPVQHRSSRPHHGTSQDQDLATTEQTGKHCQASVSAKNPVREVKPPGKLYCAEVIILIVT